MDNSYRNLLQRLPDIVDSQVTLRTRPPDVRVGIEQEKALNHTES